MVISPMCCMLNFIQLQHSNPRADLDIEYEDQKKLWLNLLELIGDSNKKKCHGALLNACKILT